MVVFFIEESNRFKVFKKIEVEQDKILLNRKIEKINKKSINNIFKILYYNNCKNIIISKQLKNNQQFLNYMYSNNINIIQGKKLLKFLVKDLIEKICKKYSIKIQECKIAFAMNYEEPNIINAIENLSKKAKMVSIISNNTNLFKEFKENLYNENGVIITLTNNRRKALLKANLIINVDFPEEVLNKYAIYDNSIIVNMEEPINIHKKRFSGKIINEYNIALKKNTNIAIELEKERYNKYELKDLAELFIMKYPEEIKNLFILE